MLRAAVEEAFTHVTTDYLRKASARMPEHGTEFNCATTVKVSILMF
jgi:hypothetical protein